MLFTLGFGTRKAGNTGGDLPRVHYVDVFANPEILITVNADATLVTTAAASNAAAGLDLTIVAAEEALLRTQPRSVAICSDAAQTEGVLVTGTDQFGTAQTETITFNGAAVVKGTKVWGSITTIHQAQRSGAANISVGWGDIFGTSRKLVGVSAGYVYVTATGKYAAVRETTTPVKSTTASVHGVTWTTAIAATNTYEIWYVSDEAR
jgi:uncharacterized protein YaiE (UPF0345 family)